MSYINTRKTIVEFFLKCFKKSFYAIFIAKYFYYYYDYDRASDISRGHGPAKSHEIPQKTRNTAKSAGNISKYMSAKHI